MPNFDGSGPSGKGSLTGRGKGYCIHGFFKRGANTAKYSIALAVIPAIAGILKDVRKPDGLVRTAFRSLKNNCRRLTEHNNSRN